MKKIATLSIIEDVENKKYVMIRHNRGINKGYINFPGGKKEENETIRKHGLEIEEIDDDAIHADEHPRYILSEYQSLTEKEKQRLLAHVSAHKNRNANKNKEGE